MVRIALMADVHACEDSLRAVLRDIENRGIDRIFCLGDQVGYGPDPAACLKFLRSKNVSCLLGNHDAMTVAPGFSLEDFPRAVARPLELARRQINTETFQWLSGLPLMVREDGFQACHSSLNNPAQFLHMKGRREVEAHFRNQSEQISFFGHTHIPVLYHREPGGGLRKAPGLGTIRLEMPGQYAVGVGSAGFSRDGDPRVCWVEWDGAEKTVAFHRLSVDHRGREDRLRALLEHA